MKFIITIFAINLLFGLNTSLSDSSDLTTNETRLYADVVIDSLEIMNKNIRILGGELNVYGTVESQITVIGGDVHIFPTGVINGKIVVIGGKVQTEDGAQINGKIIEASMGQGLIYRETFSDTAETGETNFNISTFSKRHSDGWVHPHLDLFSYNRNEGLRLSPLNWNWDRGNESLIRLSFSLGYRFSSDEFIGRTTLETSLLKNRSATLFASGFKTVRTDDDLRLPERENSLAGIFGRQDFYDRWDETGLELGFGFDFSFLKLKGKFVRAVQSEIPVDQGFGSFSNNKSELRDNPLMDKTDVEYLEGIIAFRTASYAPFSTGLAILSKAEMITKSDSLLSKPTFRMTQIAIANWEISEGLVLRNRFILGMGSESLPIFRQFGIGGLGSVSAQTYKAQLGNHMAQVNTELLFMEEFTQSWFMVKLFYDAGMAFNSPNFIDIDYISTHQNIWLESAGIGFGWDDKNEFDWGFNFAKPLGNDGSIETTIRLNLNF